jgi:hypothetical protein
MEKRQLGQKVKDKKTSTRTKRWKVKKMSNVKNIDWDKMSKSKKSRLENVNCKKCRHWRNVDWQKKTSNGKNVDKDTKGRREKKSVIGIYLNFLKREIAIFNCPTSCLFRVYYRYIRHYFQLTILTLRHYAHSAFITFDIISSQRLLLFDVLSCSALLPSCLPGIPFVIIYHSTFRPSTFFTVGVFLLRRFVGESSYLCLAQEL